MFFSDPQPLFDELADDAVLIVPHRYAPEHRHKEPTSGIYNVEWLTFRRDARRARGAALVARPVHRMVLLPLGGRQARRPEVSRRLARRVSRASTYCEHPGGGLAPWNVTQYTLGRARRPGRRSTASRSSSTTTTRFVSTGRLRPRALPRPQGNCGPAFLRLAAPWQTNYPVSTMERRLVWEPYLRSRPCEQKLQRSNRLACPASGRYPHVDRELGWLGTRSARRAAGAIEGGRPGRAPARERCSVTATAGEARTSREQMVELTEAQLRASRAGRAVRRLPRAARDRSWPSGAARPAPLARYRLRAPAPTASCSSAGRRALRVCRRRLLGRDSRSRRASAGRGRQFERRDVLEPGALDGFDVVLASALLDVLPRSSRPRRPARRRMRAW